MADISKTVGIIFQGDDNVSATSARVAAGFEKIESAAEGAARAGNLWQDAAGRWRNDLGQFASNAELAAAGIEKTGAASKNASVNIREMVSALQLVAASLVFKEFVDANVAVENFGRAMTLVTGSTAGAAESLDYVKKISNTLGLEISSTANNFVSLSAAAKGTALEGQGTRDIFEAVSKAMALLGKSSADTGGALTAIQQIISKGTVSSEELRGQLGERLPGAFQIAARAVGLTTAELGKLLETGGLAATDFLPKFAAELNKTFGDTSYVTTFNAELNRTINALKELSVTGGNAGIFGSLIEGLRDITGFIKSTSLELQYLVAVFTATKNFLATGGSDWEGYKEAIRRAGIEAGITQNEFLRTNESLAETSRLARSGTADLIDWSKQINESAAESKRLGLEGEDATDKLASAYKKLGFSAKSIGADFVEAFELIVKAAGSTGDEVSKALKVVIPKIDNVGELERVVGALQVAADTGKITWERYGVEVQKASEAFLKNTGYVKQNTDELKKQTDATEKAKENAAKLALELEKLASNERIKTLEFKAEIDVARIQADAEKVKAAFESISVGIQSTGDVLGKLFGLFNSLDSLDSSARNALFQQIEKENTLREKSFELQKQLTEAQIENMRAQTQQLQSGDALIKIDGAGLQPQLEAFMWEILKAIQVRVNRDGLKLLLGV